jgi:hypothetical protein
MNVKQAKDFLVEETAAQASLEGVPLSDIERRMMYFTESEDAGEDPLKLNEEFAAEYDSEQYEAKISQLLRHAYARLKKENPESARFWNESIRYLKKGDHYILVLWDANVLDGTVWSPWNSWKLLGTGILVTAALFGLQLWVAPLIFRREWLVSVLHKLWNMLQGVHAFFVLVCVAIVLVGLIARSFLPDQNPEGIRKGSK